MVYVAKENIGMFKKGEVVPDAQAKIWDDMYKFSPVKLLGEGEKLPEVKEPDPEPKPELRPEPPKAPKPLEDPKADAKASSESFEVELESIKGVGANTVKDILKVFPARELLLGSIKKGEDLPFRNDVVAALKKKFGESE